LHRGPIARFACSNIDHHVDFLGTIGRGHDYTTLLDETELRALGSLEVRVLSLSALIRVKEETARDKDRAVLAILRRTLAETSRA